MRNDYNQPAGVPVTIVKCPCGHPGCTDRYFLSEGIFYQGCGWSKERAQQYADAINEADARRAAVDRTTGP